ncbi:complement C1q-like protein 2 [Brachyistius frenatus]|uniref:complement C1q-like protein 2 n=1 Tax=Brachyistius frenatus TaxID=100188 RepID=UPI0037E73F38
MREQIGRMEWLFNHTFDHMKQDLQKSKMALNNMRASRSVFSVALDDPNLKMARSSHFENDKPIIYNRIFINLGNGYDTETGIFTVPRCGVYNFAVTLYTSCTPDLNWDMCARLEVNGKTVAQFIERSRQDPEDSSTAVLATELNAGDKVAVMLLSSCHICEDVSNGNYMNTFTGFLLYATDHIDTV